ncbi:MAG: hypothetical protein ABJL67_21545 [Sulfitobacter sp.]
MIDAAKVADLHGTPINRILTIRTAGMVLAGDGGILRDAEPAARIINLLTRFGEWFRQRRIPICYIWVREYCHYHREHLHFGYHIPPEYDAAFARQLALWLDEEVGPPTEKPSTIVASVLGSWQIDGCIKGDTSGHHIAAYLGKSEPNDYRDGWGKLRRNNLKKRRRLKGGEGPIEGTSKHHYRWGTSLSLGRTQRDINNLYIC